MSAVDRAMKACITGYGEILVELGREDERVVVLDADVSGRTHTDRFARMFPHRFFNIGVAEQNMMGIAAGLAASGKIPFASTFAIFAAGRAWEQVRQSIAYPSLKVRIVATHGGITVGKDGPSHQAAEDIALMRAIPRMTIVSPADYYEARSAIRTVKDLEGPVYVRLGRNPVPLIHDEDYSFELGKAVQKRPGMDLSIMATGCMVFKALETADLLDRQYGIQARVYNVHTIKPIDLETVERAASETKRIVTVEDHSIIGGLGGAIAEVVGERFPVPISRVGLRDTFCESGDPEDLLDAYGMNTRHIADACLRVLG